MVDAHWVSCMSWCGCEREVNLKWELAVQSGKGALRQSKDGWTASPGSKGNREELPLWLR